MEHRIFFFENYTLHHWILINHNNFICGRRIENYDIEFLIHKI